MAKPIFWGLRPAGTLAVWAGLLCFICGFIASAAYAEPEPIPALSHQVAGGEFEYTIERGDTLGALGPRFGIEPGVIARQNRLRLSSKIIAGAKLKIDNRHVVPAAAAGGLLLNVPQRMLFYFKDGRLAAHYPIAVGRATRMWRTPTGAFRVIVIEEDPVWRVPPSIQAEMRRKGETVKTVVAPGPGNPLGDYWMGLSIPGYGIHSTNNLASIYSFRTHGCIRLAPADAEDLVDRITVGERGAVIYEPYLLAALSDGRVFLEVDRDVYQRRGDPMAVVRAVADASGITPLIDWKRVGEVVSRSDGIAHDVTAPKRSGKP